MRHFVTEMGTGVDLHGKNGTKAALRAVRNAFQHVSLPGIRQVAGVTDMKEMVVEVVLGVPSGPIPVGGSTTTASLPDDGGGEQ